MKKRDVNIRKLSVPFANTGIKTPIPLTTQPDGKVSYEKGYTDLYQKAKKAGGLQLLLGNHNQILNDITSDTIANSDDLLALEGEVEGIINKLDNSTPKLLTQNLEWSVGSGGDFKTIQDALLEISKYISIFNKVSNSYTYVVLKIKNGYTITTPVIIDIPNVILEIKGENSKADELLIDLNNKNWGSWGMKAFSKLILHDLTIRSASINNTSIFVSSFVNMYNLDTIGNGYSTIVVSEGILNINDCNISNNFSEQELFIDLDVVNGKAQLKANVKFKSNNQTQGVAMRAATNAQIGSVWWATGIDISGTYKTGIQVDGGGVIDNPSITMNGAYTSKYSQTPGQWTASGYISSNL